jgi:hypothetical protein
MEGYTMVRYLLDVDCKLLASHATIVYVALQWLQRKAMVCVLFNVQINLLVLHTAEVDESYTIIGDAYISFIFE